MDPDRRIQDGPVARELLVRGIAWKHGHRPLEHEYMDAALWQLRETGVDVAPANVQRLSPLGYDHVNLVGRYYFGLPDAVRRGTLLALRDPLDLDL